MCPGGAVVFASNRTMYTHNGKEISFLAFHPQHSEPDEVYITDDMRDKAYNICRKFLSGTWKKISSHDMVFKSVSGGLSNLLYYCSLPETHTPLYGEPSQVLMRMYGQIPSEGNESTVTESVICTLLSERNLGPKLYGVFPGGRLEEYIPVSGCTVHQTSMTIVANNFSA